MFQVVWRNVGSHNLFDGYEHNGKKFNSPASAAAMIPKALEELNSSGNWCDVEFGILNSFGRVDWLVTFRANQYTTVGNV